MNQFKIKQNQNIIVICEQQLITRALTLYLYIYVQEQLPFLNFCQLECQKYNHFILYQFYSFDNQNYIWLYLKFGITIFIYIIFYTIFKLLYINTLSN